MVKEAGTVFPWLSLPKQEVWPQGGSRRKDYFRDKEQEKVGDKEQKVSQR